MSNSTHRVEVVRIKMERHPNADTLSVVRVFDGYTCAVRTADWQDGALAAYIPPDSVVPERPEFAFLGTHRRIKVKRLRGTISMGLLMPAPEGAKEGDDVAGLMGVTHYEPPEPLSVGGDDETPPDGLRPVFDVESLRRYAVAFIPGEEVWVTEKVHGASARYCWADGRMWCGSRTRWKKDDPKSIWWKALRATPGLAEFCEAHPEITVYGEVYGQVQDLKYGTEPGEVRFAAFDLLDEGRWVDPLSARVEASTLPWVPCLTRMPFSLDAILAQAEGPSLLSGAGHIREGCVVKPMQERRDDLVGRVCLKAIGNDFFLRQDNPRGRITA